MTKQPYADWRTESLSRIVRMLTMAAGFAIFFVPKEYAIGHSAYDCWRIACAIVSAFALLLYFRKAKVTLRWACFMLFLLFYYVISTLLTQSDGSRAGLAYYAIEVGGFITLLEYGLSTNRDLCIKAFLIGGTTMCAWHYATFLMYRNYAFGMNMVLGSTIGELTRHPWFLLTHDNGSVFYFLPVLCGIWYQACTKNRGYWFAVFASAMTLYMYWSLWTVTAMIVTSVAVALFVLIWLTNSHKVRKLLSFRKSLILGIATCVFVLAFFSLDFFSSIAAFFGKSSDMGRGHIWSQALPIFFESPVFGVGFELGTTTTFKLGINHCHNIVMQVLYTGGVAALAALLIGMFRCDAEKGAPLSKGQAVICVTILCFFVAATFDWYLYMPAQFFPFILYSYSDETMDTSSIEHCGGDNGD